jgi:hypothetical protein
MQITRKLISNLLTKYSDHDMHEANFTITLAKMCSDVYAR